MLTHAEIKALLEDAKAIRKGAHVFAQGEALVMRHASMGGARKTFTISPREDGRLELTIVVEKPKRRDPSGVFKHATRVEDRRLGLYPEMLGQIVRGWKP